ncbi:MAG: hypothetical protein ABIN58_02840, partial [candidate division WOR-3 bacterium]
MAAEGRQQNCSHGDASWPLRPSRPLARWGLTGSLLIGLHMALALLSPDFAYQRDLITQPVLILVALELLAGGLYLLV